MKTKLRLMSILLCFPLLFASCASILNGKVQKVTVHTNSPDSKVYLNEELAGEGNSVVALMPRDQQVQQVKVEREGYKDQYFACYQTRKSPWYIMSWIPFGILFYPPFADVGPKSYDYKKEFFLEQEDQKITARTDQEKFIYIKNTAFDVDEDDYSVKKIKHRNYKRKKDRYKEIETNTDKIEMDNSIFSDHLTQILEKYNYLDTTNTVLKKRTNMLYMNATVKNVEFVNVYEIEARAYQNVLRSEVVIDWELTDIYGQPLYNSTVTGESGGFSLAYNEEEQVYLCLEDAISSSFISFTNDPEVRKLMDKEEEKEIRFDYITLNKQTAPANIEEAMQASVTVVTDLGHGSGFVVSSDGYIVTNLHVIATAKKVEVVTKNGETVTAEVVRQNENKDLALLKINKNFDFAFALSQDQNYSIGQEIFAIGTPNSVQLGQTLSKGIISGMRKTQEESYIQTDASVNSGNSGGPLIDSNGILLGVVNSKLKGIGIEGIGFAIPVFEIQNSLFLK